MIWIGNKCLKGHQEVASGKSVLCLTGRNGFLQYNWMNYGFDNIMFKKLKNALQKLPIISQKLDSSSYSPDFSVSQIAALGFSSKISVIHHNKQSGYFAVGLVNGDLIICCSVEKLFKATEEGI